MLRHLRVFNFAILSDVQLELTAGLVVLTGETGAGKSLIVEAVNLLRGGRASADIPRAGAREAVVEAVFDVPDDLRSRVRAVLEAGGLPLGLDAETAPPVADDDEAATGDRVITAPTPSEIVVRRIIHKGGKSRTYVNGALTTATRLAELGALLVDLSGQHEHQGLVDASRHREILDAFAAEPAVVLAMAEAWTALDGLDRELAALTGDQRAQHDRAEYLRYQLAELDDAGLETDEEERLAVERARLAAVEELASGARAAVAATLGDDGARDGGAGAIVALAQAVRELERPARIDPRLAALRRQLDEARVLADDAAAELRRYADHLEGNPERLAWIDERLELYRRLARKHATTPAELPARAAALRAELDGLDHRDLRLAELTLARLAARTTAEQAAAALTRSRQRAGARLIRDAARALAELGLGAARLEVVVAPRRSPQPLGRHGADEVEILLSANQGEELRPLARVASGGELSRIMLALKLALRQADEVATYVFDEVDAGIGGATAGAVGALIREVARQRQVLCVTHLPQIAAQADTHFHVEKVEVGGRTETVVRRLGASARKDELARMLGGDATTRARAHAAELLGRVAARPTPIASPARRSPRERRAS